MDDEVTDEDRRAPLKGIITAIVLIILALILTVGGQIFLKAPLENIADEVVGRMGYVGIFISIFLLDLLILPLSPDVILFLSIASRAEPYISLPLICLASVLAGTAAYYVGHFLGNRKLVKRMIGKYERRGKYLVGKYGIYAIILSALTPVPYSTICMIAGILDMRYPEFLVGTLWRIPKFLTWYVIMSLGFHGF